MRTVMGWIVVAALAVGCDENGQPTPVEPSCVEAAEGFQVPTCPAGMGASCDGSRPGVAFVSATQCIGAGLLDAAPSCRDNVLTCETGEPACVEVPDISDAAQCARWAAECDAMGETECYVVAGTDDVTPL